MQWIIEKKLDNADLLIYNRQTIQNESKKIETR